jgi:hypothetical protein
MRYAAPGLILLLALVLIGDMARWPGYTITWSTANEINVAGYIIERSDSANGPWQRVSGLIVAQDDVFAAHDYRVSDLEIERHWHRLNVVTLNNEINTLGVIAP